MAGRRNDAFIWGMWGSFYAAFAFAGVYMVSKGLLEGGTAAVAACFCYTWALVGGVTWHERMRKHEGWAGWVGLLVALLGVVGVWVVVVGTAENQSPADGLLRILGSIVLLASGIVIGEAAGRRRAYLLVFGLNGLALALGYAVVDMVGRAEVGRMASVPAVFLAPVVQARGGEVLSIAIWGVLAAAAMLISRLRPLEKVTDLSS